MCKAEERSLEAYPVIMETLIPVDKENPEIKQDCNKFVRQAYIEGYHQAEKDMKLTWGDIKIILDIEIDILHECNSQKELVIKTYPKGEDYYGEILKRFKEGKC